jgi:hypothetical protein
VINSAAMKTASGKQRKRPYLGYLSKSAFAEMKRKNQGSALERAIAAWTAEHDT